MIGRHFLVADGHDAGFAQTLEQVIDSRPGRRFAAYREQVPDECFLRFGRLLMFFCRCAMTLASKSSDVAGVGLGCEDNEREL